MAKSEKFCGVHGFSFNQESFPVNHGLVDQQYHRRGKIRWAKLSQYSRVLRKFSLEFLAILNKRCALYLSRILSLYILL